ncbi:WD40 repeat-like protein [Leucogyrophana mollusca]|uniref:WD40 repeat-like protein n=1 Tax=Leucogyrophana mollusca TaxID=85980 RepID=A0ACB8B2N8_9AGAM|nr:WD40 repeat-like protein [Leucogyrophana mollusca]
MSTSSSPIEFSGVRRATRGPTKVFKGHAELVTCVAHFPDGRRFASASNDKTVIIWDVESGRQDGQPLQHDFSVGEIAISPDGRRIASGMVQGGLVIWDVLTQGVVHEVNNGVWRLAYSPDGRWIATAPMDVVREVQFWEADTGRPGRKPLNYGGDVSCVAFSPDGSQIVAGLWDGSFQVNDVSTGESVVGPIKGHTEEVWSIVYSPDGRLLVTASRDSSIRTWDSKTGVEVGNPLLGHEYAVGCISITADGRRIASAGLDKTVRVWDLETRLQIGDPFDAIVGRVHSVAFSPGGRYVISGENDEVALWDTESLAIQGSSSSPTASNRNAPHRQARTKSHNDAPSINSSLLDLPAVIQQQLATRRPQERKPSVDDDFWDADSIRPPLRPTEPQQGPPHGQETLPVQLVKPGHKWLCNIREHWQRIRPRKSPVPADIPDSSSRPPPDNQPTLPVPPEVSLGRNVFR